MRNGRITVLVFVSLVLFGLCIPLKSAAGAEPENSFYFDADTRTITKYVGDSTTVDIPQTIRGVNVLKIGADPNTGVGAFQSNTKVQSVIIPNGVSTIDQKAFFHCVSLSSVSMPNTVETIGTNAFGDCSALKSITLSSNLNRIEPYAFSNAGLESIVIPDGVTLIDFSTFSFCRSLKSVTLPANLKEIRDTAFYQCAALKRLTIPSKVTAIGANGFGLCSSLSNVYFKGNAPTLSGVPFNGMTNLKVYYKSSATGFSSSWNGFTAAPYDYKVTYMANLNAGDTYVIDEVGCLKDTSPVAGDSKGFGTGTYTLLYWTANPDGSGAQYKPGTDPILVDSDKILYGKWEPVSGVNPASDFSFDAATGTITQYRGASGKVVIPSIITVNSTAYDVKAIGDQSFQKKAHVQSVVIPSGVTSIGQLAFAECSSLKSITIPDSVTNFSRMGYIFLRCAALKTIQLPADMTAVVDGMFSESGLEHITIPSKVGSIGRSAFYGCGNLKTMCFEVSAPSLSGGAFDGVNTNMKVYYKAYAAGFTPVWNGFTTAPYTYKVTYMANRNAQDTYIIDLEAYVSNVHVTVGSYVNDGYNFMGCTTNPDGSGTQYSAYDSFAINSDITLYAKWEPITYTVNTAVNPEPGGVAAGAGVFREGETVGVIATANSGYRFVNWTDNGTEVSTNDAYSFIQGKAGRTLVANFINTYTVSIGALTDGSITASPTSAAAGEAITLTISPEGGKRLKSGSLKYNDGTQDTAITGTSFPMPAVNVMVSAEFETIPPTYTVNIGTVTGGSITPNPSTAEAGATINLTITPDSGQRLKSGSLKYNDGTQDTAITGTSFPMPAVNVTVSAEFETIPPTYTVNIGTVTGGSITANPSTAEAGTTINLTITPDSGQRLKAGSLKYNDGTQDTAITGTSFPMPAVNVTVSAEFETIPPTYTVNIGTVTGGSITANPSTAEAGATISLTITPDSGQRLKAGSLKYNDGTQDTAITGTSFPMPAVNVTVSAEFEAIPPIVPPWYSVTGVSLNRDSLNLTVGEAPVTLTASVQPAYASYPAVTWSSSNPDVANVNDGIVAALAPGKTTVTVTTVDGGKTVSCEVIVAMNPGPANHTLKLTANYSQAGTVTGGGNYSAGSLITATAAANSGYVFESWTDGTNTVSEEAFYSFNMGDSDRELTANYIKILPEKLDQAVDKPWTISFSHPVNAEQLKNDGKIYVATDEKGINQVEGIQIEAVSDNSRQICIKPASNWVAGPTYYMILENGVQSSEGQSLNIKTRMKFTVK